MPAQQNRGYACSPSVPCFIQACNNVSTDPHRLFISAAQSITISHVLHWLWGLCQASQKLRQ